MFKIYRIVNRKNYFFKIGFDFERNIDKDSSNVIFFILYSIRDNLFIVLVVMLLLGFFLLFIFVIIVDSMVVEYFFI